MKAGLVLFLALLLPACGGESQVDQPAPLYGDIPIEYPLELWDQDIEGKTLLRIRVDEMGRVDSVAVVESSGHRAFDSAAIRGARDLRFTPGRKDGKRTSVWARVPVHFSKEPRPEPPPPEPDDIRRKP